MKRSTILTSIVLAAMSLAAMPSLEAFAQMEKGESKTIIGQVVDTHCYIANNLKGPDHKMCSEVCAKNGVPLAILGDDGELYYLVTGEMPSKDVNDKVIQFAEQRVKVKGTVYTRGKARGIKIESIEAAK